MTVSVAVISGPTKRNMTYGACCTASAVNVRVLIPIPMESLCRQNCGASRELEKQHDAQPAHVKRRIKRIAKGTQLSLELAA